MYKAKLKRQKVIDLYVGMKNVANLSGVIFSYVIARNINKLQAEIDSIGTSIKPSDEFISYDKERAELAKNHAVKDDHGQPVKSGSEYVIEDEHKFKRDLAELQGRYTSVIAERESQVEEYGNLLQEEVEVELYQIHPKNIPNNITSGQLSDIYPILIEVDDIEKVLE